MPTPTHLLWLDLETTDNDPYSDHAAILEIGAIITRHDPELTEVGRASMLCRPAGGQPDHDMIWSRMDPVVRDMHVANGLWEEACSSDQAWDVAQYDPALTGWVRDTIANDGGLLPVPIAGSGTGHLDLPFVKAWMPQLATTLTYWTLDIGPTRRMLELAGRADLVDLDRDVHAKPHRGLGDVEMHLTEARRYLELLTRLTITATSSGEQPTADPIAE